MMDYRERIAISSCLNSIFMYSKRPGRHLNVNSKSNRDAASEARVLWTEGGCRLCYIMGRRKWARLPSGLSEMLRFGIPSTEYELLAVGNDKIVWGWQQCFPVTLIEDGLGICQFFLGSRGNDP